MLYIITRPMGSLYSNFAAITSQVVCLQRLTWHSNPLLLIDEGVDGHNVKGSIEKWAGPGHGFIPVAVTDTTLMIRVNVLEGSKVRLAHGLRDKASEVIVQFF